MRAFQNIRTEMRENAIAVTRIGGPPETRAAARIDRRRPREEEESPVEWWMEEAFEGLTQASETGAPFALVPCYMNGEPAVVIALAKRVGRRTHMMPLFLACQPWMKFSGEPGGGEDEDGDEEGGGPDRASTQDAPAPR